MRDGMIEIRLPREWAGVDARGALERGKRARSRELEDGGPLEAGGR